ncbi:hypothetical protein [Saccharothrix obliqua]|uniref:hypothetical protein n=1 Tax=Saccharothrix obliqua TaxID=2861747 RepID=UPI001C5CD23F|nr:hypothetical protein [Saccharothrix obliqua]MBW4721987.1 hypothetical protein [Saccharothrix obliqua]
MKHVPLLVAVAILALAACGPKAPEAADKGKADRTTTRETPAEPTTADGHTSPGMRLKVGEAAVLPVSYGDERKGTVNVTVTAIEQGTPEDLARFPAEQVTGVTPYRIKYTVEYVRGDDLSNLVISLVGRAADGTRKGMVGLAGDSAECDSKSAGEGFNTPGAKYETCDLAGAKDDAVLAHAAYNVDDYNGEKAVLWAK